MSNQNQINKVSKILLYRRMEYVVSHKIFEILNIIILLSLEISKVKRWYTAVVSLNAELKMC